MAQLLLRGVALGEVKALLFDKDGTLSISEPQLITLAEARVFLCLERVEAPLRGELRQLLMRAYGLRPSSGAAAAGSLCPAGITAVASRDHNLIATATALVQVGLGWPEALLLSEQVFALADRIDARRAGTAVTQSQAGTAVTQSRAGMAVLQSQASSVIPTINPSGPGMPINAGKAAPTASMADATRTFSGSETRTSQGADRPPASWGSEADSEPQVIAGAANPGSADLVTHLDSAGQAIGGTSRTTAGLRDWLERLRSASVACAVISNDDVAGIEHFLASHDLESYFAAIWSAEHRPRKPDPAAVHGLCQLLGVEAGACALIGDANSDLRMAVAAGIPHQRALGYTAAWRTPPPLAEPHPLVHHWHELSLA